MKTAIRKHLRDFVAVIGLIVISGAVASYILANQRLTLPGWVPVVGQEFYEIEAELSTAQAVTPGQGQTVNVAGVEVGEIKSVKLDDGRAIIGMKIQPKYSRIYKDATVLLRPKTGLRDMVAELEPGTKAAGRLPEGGRIPVSQTLPDVNLDEILAALDADTRDYLQLLLNDGGEALRGNGRNLADTIRRIEPTAKLSRRVNEALAERRTNIKRGIHNFSLLVDELGDKDDQVAEFVTDSNAVFASLASQDAALRETLRELPSSLTVTQDALGSAEALADELGPTLQALRPSARTLGPTLRAVRPFLRETTRSSATSCARSPAPRCPPCASCARRCAISPPRRPT
jgi:phospholipid/cholesterol/gamma-HCH transport system substrate-binding protein